MVIVISMTCYSLELCVEAAGALIEMVRLVSSLPCKFTRYLFFSTQNKGVVY